MTNTQTQQNDQMILSSQVLAERMAGITKEVSELKGRFDSFTLNFVPTNVYNIRHEELVREVNDLKADMIKVKSNRWLISFVSILLGALLAFLVEFALTH